jgi:hypothetical protein
MPVIVLGRSELVGRSKRQESESKRGWYCHDCHAYNLKACIVTACHDVPLRPDDFKFQLYVCKQSSSNSIELLLLLISV